MTEQILISEKVKSFITAELKTGYSHIVTHDLINEVNVKLSGNNDPVFVLFFISDDELEPLADFLKESGDKNIFYRVVVLGLNRDVNSLNPENFSVISEYRNTPISEKDLGYIIDKSFSQIREDYNKVKILSEYITSLDDMRQDQEDLINIGLVPLNHLYFLSLFAKTVKGWLTPDDDDIFSEFYQRPYYP